MARTSSWGLVLPHDHGTDGMAVFQWRRDSEDVSCELAYFYTYPRGRPRTLAPVYEAFEGCEALHAGDIYDSVVEKLHQ